MIISHTSEFFWKAKYNPFSLATSSSHWAYGSQACCLCCYAFVWASSGSQISPRAAVLFVMCLTMAPSPRQLALFFILWILKHTFCCSAHRLTHGTLFLFWPATAIIVPCISPLGKAKHPLHVLCTHFVAISYVSGYMMVQQYTRHLTYEIKEHLTEEG